MNFKIDDHCSGPKAQEKNQVGVLRTFANLFVTAPGENMMIEGFELVCIKFCIKTHSSELQGQVEAALHIFMPMQPLQ